MFRCFPSETSGRTVKLDHYRRPPVLGLEDLPPHITGLTKVAGAERTGGPRTLDEVERVHILRVLDELGQNHTRAAEVLGIDRRTLYRKLDKYKIEYTE